MTIDNKVSISVSARTVPDNNSATITAKICKQHDRESPPYINIVFTNISSTSKQFDFGFTPPFSVYELSAKAEDRRLVCIPPNHPQCSDGRCIPEAQRDGCWTALNCPDIIDSGSFTTLSPKESFEQTYAILNHPSNDKCFPLGKYSGTDAFRINSEQSTYEMVLEIDVKNTMKRGN